jgi:hypothetical protein
MYELIESESVVLLADHSRDKRVWDAHCGDRATPARLTEQMNKQ